jgi:hypothetical protein
MARALRTASIAGLLRQRHYGLALGHEELCYHDALRHDPEFTAVIDKPSDALAGNTTLNPLQHASKIGFDRHHKFDRPWLRALCERIPTRRRVAQRPPKGRRQQ